MIVVLLGIVFCDCDPREVLCDRSPPEDCVR